MRDLGASEIYNIDPKVNDSDAKYFKEHPEEGIRFRKESFTPENYREALDNKRFHLSFSVEVFDFGSGLLDPADEMALLGEKLEQKYASYFAPVADSTLEGGISIHVGRNVPHNPRLLADIGFKLICKIDRKDAHSTGDIYIFQKTGKGE